MSGLDERYKYLLDDVMENGEPHKDRTGVGTTSLFGYQLQTDLRHDGFPLLTLRRLPFRWIAGELMWMLSGSTDERVLSGQGVHTWAPWATAEECAKFGREPGDLGPTYGHQLRKFGSSYSPLPEYLDRVKRLRDSGIPRLEMLAEAAAGFDQLWDLCRRMDEQPNSRRLVVSQWDPRAAESVSVPPCHPLWQVKLHDSPGKDPWSGELLQGGISLRVDQRSCDAAVGLAFDLAHYGLLLCLLAWCTSREPRKLVFQFGDIHVYDNHHEGVAEVLRREPRPTPAVEITKDMFHAVPGAPGQDTFINLLQFRPEHLKLVGYDPHPAIRFEVAK